MMIGSMGDQSPIQRIGGVSISSDSREVSGSLYTGDSFKSSSLDDSSLIPDSIGRGGVSGADQSVPVDSESLGPFLHGAARTALGVALGVIGGVLGFASGVLYDCTIAVPIGIGVEKHSRDKKNGTLKGNELSYIIREFAMPVRLAGEMYSGGHKLGSGMVDSVVEAFGDAFGSKKAE